MEAMFKNINYFYDQKKVTILKRNTMNTSNICQKELVISIIIGDHSFFLPVLTITPRELSGPLPSVFDIRSAERRRTLNVPMVFTWRHLLNMSKLCAPFLPIIFAAYCCVFFFFFLMKEMKILGGRKEGRNLVTNGNGEEGERRKNKK